jgi:hypothetical protein
MLVRCGIVRIAKWRFCLGRLPNCQMEIFRMEILFGKHTAYYGLLFLRRGCTVENAPPFLLVLLTFMTSDNLDILIVGVPDDDNSSSALACPCSHSERLNPTHPGPSRTSPRTSATDNRDHLFPPIPVLRSPQISLDVFGSSSSCVSSSHPPHPSPTHPSTCSSSQSSSIQWAANSILSRDKDEEQDRRRKRGNSSTERNAKYNSSLRPSPLRSAHSDVATSPTPAHVDASSDAGLRPSSVTRFFRRTIRRVRRSSSSPNGATDTLAGSDTTRNDGQKGDHVEVKGKRTRPAPLDLKQEADFGYFQKQTTVLDNLKERLETANKLHEEAVDLETLYESGTVAAGRDFRATGKPVPCCLQKQNTET